MRSFIRQKTIYCGDKYREIDIFPYTMSQEEYRKRGKRAKREKVTEPKQRNLNDKNAKRYLVQLANTNFGEKDLHVSATYKDKFLPASIKDAEREAYNFLRRIKDKRKSMGLEPLKYILITEYVTEGEGDGESPVRIHHHIIMNGGLDRDEVEDLWCRRREKGQKKGERLGWINADRLQPYANGIEALCKYLTKFKRKKRWSSSQNLKKPLASYNDNNYGKREVENLSKDLPGRAFWENKYPGWTLVDSDYGVKAEFNKETSQWSIYLKMRRIE